jgi:hypothetical protein
MFRGTKKNDKSAFTIYKAINYLFSSMKESARESLLRVMKYSNKRINVLIVLY